MPDPFYDGHPEVPFGGPPFGTSRRTGPPGPVDVWPNAARRATDRRTARAAWAPGNRAGSSALVLGVVGLLCAPFPVAGVVALPLMVAGLVLGVLGIARTYRGRATNRGTPVAGTVLCALALVVCAVVLALAPENADAFRAGFAEGLGAVPAVVRTG
ncbi:hypothetical protein WIS52_29460 [Pseudonocardia nematodicida]|uniref:DUF4190 domain-containing protein n=1 Tax=Pseudonocardia nematodicida TaxID=1206997 RepID=A0ABV1KKV9_9PSEU